MNAYLWLGLGLLFRLPTIALSSHSETPREQVRFRPIGSADLRLAVVSPFLDRRHGTERCIAEQLERFAKYPDTEIHLYAQHVEDLSNLVRYPAQATGTIVWHKVPRLPGPHLFGYLWWFLANHLQRWWDEKVSGLKFDLLYSPGINTFDADAISIHVIFNEFYQRVRPRLVRNRNLTNVHRQLYYNLICLLEKVIYRQRNSLTTISAHSSACLLKFFSAATCLLFVMESIPKHLVQLAALSAAIPNVLPWASKQRISACL